MSILITGAAVGLGAAIAKRLTSQYPIVIHYRKNKEKALELQKDLGAEIIYGDFSTQENVALFMEEYLERFPHTKAVIHNVGNYFLGSYLNTDIKNIQDLMQTNFYAPLFITQKLIPSLKKTKGSIITIGFCGLSILANTYFSAYHLSKLSLLQLTKSLAKELAPFQVRANMISPGYLEVTHALPKKMEDIPMKRLGKLKEVAHIVEFLLENEYVTAQNIDVAGGLKL